MSFALPRPLLHVSMESEPGKGRCTDVESIAAHTSSAVFHIQCTVCSESPFILDCLYNETKGRADTVNIFPHNLLDNGCLSRVV